MKDIKEFYVLNAYVVMVRLENTIVVPVNKPFFI
jgi:hypothetical protein